MPQDPDRRRRPGRPPARPRPRRRTGTRSRSSSNRTPDDIRDGRVMSSQCMFDAALQHERDLGIDFWEDECPPIEGISLVGAGARSGGKAIDWAARLERPRAVGRPAR